MDESLRIIFYVLEGGLSVLSVLVEIAFIIITGYYVSKQNSKDGKILLTGSVLMLFNRIFSFVTYSYLLSNVAYESASFMILKDYYDY